jgi:hypothetical protein
VRFIAQRSSSPGRKLGREHQHGDKTFKGLTDATLAWQTERFLELETHREGITVFARPVLVAEADTIDAIRILLTTTTDDDHEDEA